MEIATIDRYQFGAVVDEVNDWGVGVVDSVFSFYVVVADCCGICEDGDQLQEAQVQDRCLLS